MYVFEFTDGNGCASKDSSTLVVEDCLGIEENTSRIGVDIFPNPNNGTFEVVINGELHGDVNVFVTDAIGNIVWKANVDQELRKVVDISAWSHGVYFLHVRTEVGSVSKN